MQVTRKVWTKFEAFLDSDPPPPPLLSRQKQPNLSRLKLMRNAAQAYLTDPSLKFRHDRKSPCCVPVGGISERQFGIFSNKSRTRPICT